MEKIQKGQKGYIDSQKKIKLLLCIAGLVIILADFFTGLAITGTRKNLFTVVAILLALPEGKFLATYLVFFKHKSTPEDFIKKVEARNLKYSVVYDCVFSTREKVVPVYAAVLGPDFVLCYTNAANVDRKKFETSLEEFVKAGKVKVKVSLMTEEKGFFNRLDQLSANDGKISDYDKETIDMVKTSVLAMCM